MAEQSIPHQVRPFMSKQTFDQASTVMWGQNNLDYHTNYILPRANWDDSDIRDEAVYFAGFAHALRVRSSPKPLSQTMTQHSQTDVADDVNKSPDGPRSSASGERDSFDVAFRPQGATQTGVGQQRSGTPSPFQVLSAASPTTSSYGLDIPASIQSLSEGGSHCVASWHTPSDDDSPICTDYAPDAHGLAPQPQPARLEKIKNWKKHNIADPSYRALSSPDGLTVDLCPPVTVRSQPKGNNIMAPLIERLAEEKTVEDHYAFFSTSALEGNIHRGEYSFDEIMEEWLNGQAEKGRYYGF